ncbi:MAG: VWA domain-containing protein [Pseudomonadota bacterium]
MSTTASPTPQLIEFTRFLRDHGFNSGIQEALDVLNVSDIGGVLNKTQLHWQLRSLLCSSQRDWEKFDALFAQYWRRHLHLNPNNTLMTPPPAAQETQIMEVLQPAAGEQDSDAELDGDQGGASREENLAKTDFRHLVDTAQMREIEALIERLARRLRRRLMRRRQTHPQGSQIHLRRTLRRSISHGGTPLDLVFTRRRRFWPRMVILLDVSRSMNLYSSLFLRFARGLVQTFKQTHVFAFHTDLINVTDALASRDYGEMQTRLAQVSAGWAGGTRIGGCLETFNQTQARRVLNGRSVFIIMSDGFDTDMPEALAEQLSRIQSRVRRVVWLNPLKGWDGYEPRAAGMQAALPFIDVFASAHNLESLVALEDVLGRL